MGGAESSTMKSTDKTDSYEEKKDEVFEPFTDQMQMTKQSLTDRIKTERTCNGKHARVEEGSDGQKAGPEKKKRKKADGKTKNDFSWICCLCNEAECITDPDADLLVCQGKCNRPFHPYCADLARMPSENEDWYCEDCVNQKHQCAFCQQYGVDSVDVFLCQKEGCGLFFHESCLSMQNVEVALLESDTVSNEVPENGLTDVVRTPLFTCPAHSCWTCTEDFVPAEASEDKNKQTNKKKNRSKGNKKRVRNNSFAQKNEQILFRCLHCPIAYHTNCIPPLARFHELALLCHEHAATHKLPDLDMETSIQGQVEAQIEKKLEKARKEKTPKASHSRGDEVDSGSLNPFFPGVRGDTVPSNEELFRLTLDETLPGQEYLDAPTSFCLPCDIKQQVHSKPPSYRHVHSLQYDPANRPKPNPPTNETCNCRHSSCGESCLNRMVMMECIGDKTKANGEKNPYWNCDVGPSCGNRQLSQRSSVKCKPLREKGKGWGLVSIGAVKKGDLVLEYVGEVIDEKTKQERLEAWAREHPNDPNFYVMQLDQGWYIDARHKANLSRFVNHSCQPNCRLTRMNVGGQMRIGIFSLRNIAPGEFLSYDYQFDTKHGDKFLCRCGAENCRGTMKGGRGVSAEDENESKTKKEEWLEAKARFERDKKFLEETKKREEERLSQVDVLVPCASKETETVAGGPRISDREMAGRTGIFLWRNIVRGQDFSARWTAQYDTSKKATKTPKPKDDRQQLDVLAMVHGETQL